MSETINEPEPEVHSCDIPELRLSRYLYIGKEYLNYQSGNWFAHNYYEVNKVPSIIELAMSKKKHEYVVELIQKAFQSNLVPNPETLVFALAVCVKQDKCESLRTKAYNLVSYICAKPQHFFLFIKFVSELSKTELKKSGGWGHGLKNAVCKWYTKTNSLDLAEKVTQYRGKYGWTHKDIIKLSHIRPTTAVGFNFILKYIMYGLETAKKEASCQTKNKVPTFTCVQSILEYIEDVEAFKHCEDEHCAAALIEKQKLQLEHVPSHLIKSEEVWNSLIPLMDLSTLLNNLQRIHNMKMLKPNSLTVAKIIDEITNEENIKKAKIHPIAVLIALRNYESSGRPLSYEKRKVREEAKKPLPPPPKPNQTIVEALNKMLNLSWANVNNSTKRYMITINVSKSMLENKTWHNGNINPVEAGCIIALSLSRSSPSVVIATYNNNTVQEVDIPKTATLPDVMKLLVEAQHGNVRLSSPITWAMSQKREIDVFINVVEQIDPKVEPQESYNSRNAIEDYRNEMSISNAKLINCAMCSPKVPRHKHEDPNILTTCGFDIGVPMVIEAFVESLF
ncbi:60 kDa SS-A/Ro ribonucleoprotein [Cephus cinctus]|uniref:60 kDa SS-A/Ro ribonucleoprotein n=1 Tax=Cephus cinctus TaxID=211228 RepID=A0AAJ7BXC3_CEPCN|nr:60 kDa SS-A/Ro ribonucleoprotein [Cephus cinctus]XP_015596737.1 60 kDa SS-A/Ro ribonucleoprotein [Cephus cinctus]XP_015596738.1 60 kDa SS-A/Ro ribonucleoprotein [Cephus cinctus]